MSERLTYREQNGCASHEGILRGQPHNVIVETGGASLYASLDGDEFLCYTHGTQRVYGTAFTKWDGINLVKIGDITSCGAVIIGPCDNTNSD